MSILQNDNRLNNKTGIFTALSSFNLSFLGKKMTIGAPLPTFDPTRLQTMLYTSNVTGVNGTWTTAGSSEASPVVGTVYQMYVQAELPAGANATQPRIYGGATLTAVAATTSFVDLITQFAAQLTSLNLAGIGPLPATAAVTASHLVITEAPGTGYGAGEAPIKVGDIVDPVGNVTIASFVAGIAHVSPVGNYEAALRLYQSTQPHGFNANVGASQWWGANTPTSGHAYDVLTIVSSPIDKPNNDADAYVQFTVLVDTAVTPTTTALAYIAGTIGNYVEQAGLGVGSTIPVIPIATTAANIGIIPQGATSVSVTSASASNFVALPTNYPIGKTLYITGNATGYRLIMASTESINSGTIGAGSSAIPASVILQAQKNSATNWIITAQLLTGAGTVTAVPANA